ncbi:hypothetical protein D3C81_1848970 [compost metagenome]
MGGGGAANVSLVTFHQALQGLVGAEGVLRLGWRGVFFGGLGQPGGEGAGQQQGTCAQTCEPQKLAAIMGVGARR